MDKINVNKSDFLALQEYASEQLRKEFDSVGLTDSLPIMEKAYRLNLMELFDDMLGDARCSCDTAAQRWVLKTWFENLTEDDSDFSGSPDPHDFNVPNDTEAAVPGLEFIVTEINQERVKVA